MGRSLSPLFFAPLSKTLVAFVEIVVSGHLFREFSVSLRALAAGYALAAAFSIPLGLLMARYRTMEYLLDHYVTASLAMPAVALIPLAVIIFGLGVASRAAVVFLFVFPTIAVNTFRGAKTLRADLEEMARSFLLNERQILRDLVFPNAAPLIFAGLRLGFGLGLVGMLLGELTILSVGMGGMLFDYMSRYMVGHLFATILAILLIAVAGGLFIERLDRRLNRWARR